MSHSPFDSDIFSDLFGDPFVRELLSDEAFIRAMMTVEGHLAQVQGQLGLIPSESGEAIFEAATHLKIEPVELAKGTASDGIPVPAFVRLFREKMGNTEHAQYVHWGATSQDIMDTGLVLRVRHVLTHIEGQIRALLAAFAQQAETHRTLPMAARTRNQVATPTSFGARVAVWGSPFLRHLERLSQARSRFETISFAGASSNLAALGGCGQDVADALADSLGLARQDTPWHAARDNPAEISGVLTLIAGSMGKFAEDLIAMGQSELQEVRLGASGGSSTMPHKSNPVAPEVILTLAQVASANAVAMNNSVLHRGERDGAAWGIEWHGFGQVMGAVSGAMRHGIELAEEMRPEPARMMATIDATRGLMFAEAATFELARTMARPDAQAVVKQACREAVKAETHLRDHLASKADLDWDTVFTADRQIGAAPQMADRFVEAVKQIK